MLIESRSRERGESAVKEVGQGAFAFHLEVTDQASITSAAERVWNEFGRLDLPIQNAASRIPRSSPVSPLRSTQRRVRAPWLWMKCDFWLFWGDPLSSADYLRHQHEVQA
ncbi:hypothetical protein [Paraburkholderia hospita]|uniref:hypothetical protein n=1 Tax=Paraburkholderia hospita TaxID=169430 RepID=UPI001FC9B258|nr:hypothetical protein [Paraburkholderia hospita]